MEELTGIWKGLLTILGFEGPLGLVQIVFLILVVIGIIAVVKRLFGGGSGSPVYHAPNYNPPNYPPHYEAPEYAPGGYSEGGGHGYVYQEPPTIILQQPTIQEPIPQNIPQRKSRQPERVQFKGIGHGLRNTAIPKLDMEKGMALFVTGKTPKGMGMDMELGRKLFVGKPKW